MEKVSIHNPGIVIDILGTVDTKWERFIFGTKSSLSAAWLVETHLNGGTTTQGYNEIVSQFLKYFDEELLEKLIETTRQHRQKRN